MSDAIATKPFSLTDDMDSTLTTREKVARSLKRRYAAERRFRFYGQVAIGMAVASLVLLFATIIANGYGSFVQTEVRLTVAIDSATIDPDGKRDPETLSTADYTALIRESLFRAFPEVESRQDRRLLQNLVSSGGSFELRARVLADPGLVGKTIEIWLPTSDEVDLVWKGQVPRTLPEDQRPISDKQLAWLDRLAGADRLAQTLNVRFLTSGDSREPELAGIWSAVVGSFLTMVVTLALSFPLGVAAAIYLEEFAAQNIWNQILEANINNLAAVPSIVFGLLGLAVFLNFFGMPRSAPIAGGVVLAIMTLPTIIIAGRAALKSVPPSIREAAYGVGASSIQTVFHHVLPLAMPGMLTGAIIGMARALGESAPLLMIGMVAFIVDVPHGFTDPATVLPVQVYLWADSAERAFVEKTSGAIIVLLAFLILMNTVAIYLRNKFETRW